MKDNLNIEKLFKDKFENFEADVSPNIWANVAKGISANSAVNTGVGLGLKSLIIGVSAVIVGVSAYFIGGFNTTDLKVTNEYSIEINSKQDVKNDELINTELIVQSTQEIIGSDDTNTILTNEKVKFDEVTLIEQLNGDSKTNFDDVVETNSISNETIVNNLNATNNTVKNITEPTENLTTENVVDVVEKTSKPVIPNANIMFSANSNPFEYTFNANAQDAIKFDWNFGDGLSSNEENPVHFFTKKGDYEVTLRLTSEDNHIFETKAMVTIESISNIDEVPNVFTPNGDRIDDEFFITSENIETFSIVIQNQYGAKMFESNDVNFRWDGTDFNGDLVPKAVYSYYIKAIGTDGAIFKLPGLFYVR